MQNPFNANSNGGIGDAALPAYDGREALCRVCGGIGDAALPAYDGREALCRVCGGIGDAVLPMYTGRGASPMRPQRVLQSP